MRSCYNRYASQDTGLALLSRPRSTVALDIGSSHVKMLELEVDRAGRPRLKHFGVAAVPPEAIVDGAFMNTSAVIGTIRELLARHKVKTKDASVAVSGNSVIIKRISLPQMTKDELDESIAWEAEQYIPFDVNDVNIDAHILPSRSNEAGQMDVLLVAARKEIVNEYQSLLLEAGLKPAVVDVAAFALENMYELNYERTDGTVALVNVGASSVNINILRGGASAFTRDLAMGGRAYTEEIQRVMGVSYEEAEAFKVGGGETDRASVVPEEVERVLASVSETLAAEIYRSVDFYMGSAGGGGIGQLWLSGGAAPTPGLQGALARLSGANVQVVDPFRRIQVDERSFNPRYLRDVAPQAAVAVGLGLRKADDK
jgi:type IV pilus assembly protein PilM